MRFLFIVMLALLPQTTPLVTRATVEGRITRFNSETPIANVEVAIVDDAGGRAAKLEGAVSDAEGQFVIEGVPPGAYTIRAQRGGFIPPESNGVAIEDGGATKKLRIVSGQNRVSANVSLMAGAVIGGTILDPDGRPAAKTEMSAERVGPNGDRPVTVRTNNRGEYRFYTLPPGAYRVFATPAAIERDLVVLPGQKEFWFNTYFPGVMSPGRAVNIELTEGAIRNDADFQIQRDRAFSVSVRLPEGLGDRGLTLIPVTGPTSGEGAPPRWFRPLGVDGFRRESKSLGFTFPAVRPGLYDLFLIDGFPIYGLPDPDQLVVLARAAVVVSDADVSDVRVEAGAIDVRGQIMTMDSSVKPAVSIGLKHVAASNVNSLTTKTDPSGKFTISGMVAGRWKLVVRDLPANVAVLDVLQGGESVYENGFEISEGTPEPLKVMLSPAGAIEGTVHGPQQRPVTGAFVVLIPAATNTSNAALYRQVQADGGGRFKIPAVPNGSYLLFAFASAPSEQSSLPSAAEIRTLLAPYGAQGASVTVSAERTETRTIPVIELGPAR